MRHGYFMLPLEPSRGVRNARTLCKETVRPSALAWPGQDTITCVLCKGKAVELQHTYLDLARKVTPNSAGEVQVKRMLDRLGLVLGEDAQTTWHLRYSETWVMRDYFIYERADHAFWSYALNPDDTKQDLFLHPTDARAAARAEIDRLVEAENG